MNLPMVNLSVQSHTTDSDYWAQVAIRCLLFYERSRLNDWCSIMTQRSEFSCLSLRYTFSAHSVCWPHLPYLSLSPFLPQAISACTYNQHLHHCCMEQLYDGGQKTECCYGNRTFLNNANGPRNHHTKFESFWSTADFIKILKASDFPRFYKIHKKPENFKLWYSDSLDH